MKISYFFGVAHTTPVFVDIGDVFTEIKEGKHKSVIQNCRKALDSGDKDKYNLLKKSLPCYTISCRTANRKVETLQEYTGLMQGDLDNLTGDVESLRDELFKDPHVAASFLSPSGRGVKLWIRVIPDATKHKDSFYAAEKHFKTKYDLTLDPSCKDVARLFFQSWDPDARIKKNSIPIPLIAETIPDLFDVKSEETYRLEDYERAAEALKLIPPEEYQMWAECAMALKDGLGEKGFKLFADWSKQSSKCNPSELRYKWDSFDRDWKGERITFQTLFFHAKDPCTHKVLDAAPVLIQRNLEPETLHSGYFSPPGFVGQFAEFQTSHSRFKQPIISLAASLCFTGAMIGRKYRTEENTRSNLFITLLSPTGSGKQFPRDVIKKFDQEHDLRMFGSEKVTSRAAIERLISWRPSCLFLIDEFGMYLKQLMATTTGYQADIISTLMEVFTSSTGYYYPLDRAAQEDERFSIDQPCLSVFSTSTPDTYWEGLNSGKIRDGSMNRFLIFQTPDKRPERHRPPMLDKFPASLIDQALKFRDTPISSKRGNIVPVTGHPDPITLRYSDESFICFENLEDECTKLIDARSVTSSMWVRVTEYAKKIALIVAVGDGKDKIELEYAQYGCELVRFLTLQAIVSINQNLSDNQNERLSKKVERLIRDSGKGGISSSILTQQTRYLNNSRHRKEILSDLQDSGLVVCVKTKAENTYKPVERWHYVG
jgi:hypothetical protein